MLLTLARIRYNAATGRIAPKDVAADWVIVHLPDVQQPLMSEARRAYLGHCEDRLALHGQQLTDLIASIKREAGNLLELRH